MKRLTMSDEDREAYEAALMEFHTLQPWQIELMRAAASAPPDELDYSDFWADDE